ncbi:MAG: FAD-dependent oxidoreductase [Ectobacillus sp.]
MNANHNNTKGMPQFPEPYWRESANIPSFPKLAEDIQVDVAIAGGGISGITAAYLLAQEGFKVAILEAGSILNGTTGHTTAKITAQHDLIYDELINHLGKEKAKLYYKANSEALEFIKQTIQKRNINCDFSEEDAYLYANSSEYAHKIITELQAYKKLGIDGDYVDSIPFDIPIKAGLVMRKQGQFHPLKYLANLVQEITEAGSSIYENTTAIDIEEGKQPKVITRDGYKVSCKFVISCTHFPFFDGKSFYFARMYADRSYVLAVKPKQQYPGGMYLSVDEPVRSLRYTPINGEKLVLIGGGSHKTGQGIDTMKYYKELEAFSEEVLGIQEYCYRWSAQDLTTLDKLPYIGHITSGSPNIFVATGYRKWGMTSGTAAALLLRDLIMEKDNPYKELYTPSRFHADPDIKNFIIQNADVAAHLIEGKLDFNRRDIHDLANDEGAVVTVNGQRAGAYKDNDGILHVVDTTCTHMGCELEWNHGDRSWDCPCHGSRFSIDGEVIEGPAKKPLKKLC